MPRYNIHDIVLIRRSKAMQLKNRVVKVLAVFTPGYGTIYTVVNSAGKIWEERERGLISFEEKGKELEREIVKTQSLLTKIYHQRSKNSTEKLQAASLFPKV